MLEVLCYPDWLFNTELSDYTYVLKETPVGVLEQTPNLLLKNQQNYVLWDLLSNDRMMRMFENEFHNGKEKAFTAVEMMDMLHRSIFAQTLKGATTDVMSRNLQKAYVDALITAAAESEGVKINKSLYENPLWQHRPGLLCGCHEELSLGSAPRNIDMYGKQVNRTSDAISVKRGELIRILNLLKSKRATGDTATRFHYEDLMLRIQTALGLNK